MYQKYINDIENFRLDNGNSFSNITQEFIHINERNIRYRINSLEKT